MVALFAALILHADPRMEIQRQYDRWSKAYMARDAETLIGILSPDYVLVNVKKVATSYDVYVAGLRLLGKSPPSTTKYSTAIKKLTLNGDEAEVVSIETMSTTSSHSVTFHRHEYLDLWIHYDAGWRLRRTTTVRESTEVKPING